MRTNLPVTDKEYVLRDDTMIVSKTDLKGLITYINKDFVEASGFAEHELMKQAHNLVRHPDMPPEAFKDLWDTLKANKPWVGYVKNRRKNGDYYWVEAHAAPVWEGNQVAGYMSVRRKAARDKIEACERAYRMFREGRAKGLVIRDGQVVSNGWVARMRRMFQDTGVATKIVAGCALAAVLIMGGTNALLGNFMASRLEAGGLADLNQNLKLIKGMVEVRAEAMRMEANRTGDMILATFPDSFSVSESGDVPTLKHGSAAIGGRTAELDRLAEATGGYINLLARKGDRFVRVYNTLKNDKGERDVGTVWAADHPAHAAMLAGKAHVTFRTSRHGKDYLTSYSALKDPAGKVVGALSAGIDVSADTKALKQHLRSIKVGETGYFYVLDGNPGKSYGTLIVHPAKEGSNILGAKDASGREFIKEILAQKQGSIRYPWANSELGDASAREKVVVFDTFSEWQWVIGGGTYTDEFEGLSRTMQVSLAGMAAIVVLALVLIIYGLVRRLVAAPLQNQVLPAFRALSGGHYNNAVDTVRNDEIGKVLHGLETMQSRLGFEVTEAARIGNEALRIKVGLDNVSTNVMIGDPDGTIIYCNTSLLEMFGNAQNDIRTELPAFDAGKLVGANIDVFHKNPAHQRGMLERLGTTHRAAIKIGGRSFSLTVNPVKNATGQLLGFAVEWIDRTAEVAVEVEVADIVQAASAGDFGRRIDLAGKQGFFKQLGEGINRLMQVSHEGLEDVAKIFGALARGDLTERIEADYAGTFGKLKDDSNATVSNLTDIVQRIRESTDAINTAAREIAQGNTDLSQRTEEQASSLEETASSMEELTSTVKQNAENSKQANQLAQGATAVASRGGEVVRQVVDTMSSINESSKKIVDIISVIDGIAFQTNILALNAAVEAARAGEQGRGFAVVASEVRSLAQRSAAAAKEIKTLIGDSVGRVDAGSKLVESAGKTMDEIVTAVKRVTDIMGEITAASQEQSSGIEQVNQAITQMDQVTQQNAALVEQVAAAAESMRDQAGTLSQAVSVFALADQPAPGEASAAAAKPAHRPGAGKAAGKVVGTRTAATRPPANDAARPRKVVNAKSNPAAGSDGDWEEF